MKNRCHNPKAANYARYGGKGVVVCDEWRSSFETFARDMGPKPSYKHSIERKDNTKGYNKDNCRWATTEEQAANKKIVRDKMTGKYITAELPFIG